MTLVDDIRTIQRHCGVTPDGIFGPLTAQAVLRELRRRDVVEVDDSELDDPVFDARTAGCLALLDEKAQDRFAQLTLMAKATAATYGCEYVMISSHRSWEEQDALYAQGRTKPGAIVTKARGGFSNHNFGIACDYGVFRGKVYLDSADAKLAAEVHAAVAVHARKLGFEWGGDWKTLKDFPHFEISTGLSMTEKRELWKRKGSVL